MANKYWHVQSKWLRHLALANHRTVNKHIPATGIFSKETLFRYLNRFPSVFVKPVYGSFGFGVMKITKVGSKQYSLRYGTRNIMFRNRRQLLHTVLKLTRGRKFLIQRGIQLISINNRPIDFRVLLLKPGKQWLYMGTMGKIAAPRKIVTNFNNGGSAIGLEQALARSSGKSAASAAALSGRLKTLGLTVAKAFNNRYHGVRKMGIDIGIDSHSKVWILEINTNPRYQLFRFHRNKKLFGQIHRHVQQIHRSFQ